MSGTNYANAVGAVRAMESSLLSRNDIDQLIAARTNADLQAMLASKKNTDTPQNTLQQVWELIQNYAPDCEELKILLYRNDFHNLKAVIKAMIHNRDPKLYYIEPSNVSIDELKEAVSKKEYDILPVYMRETAAQAYKLVTETLDGQLSDMLIDKACLEAMKKSADELGNGFMQEYAKLIADCVDIKTAYRSCLMKKTLPFIEKALCGCGKIDKEDLARAAAEGTDTLFAYLENTSFSDGAALLKSSPAQFEKWCDDIITEHAESARMMAFGIEPLAAYFIAKEAEIKDLRILTVCKESGTDNDTITERMRKLYV
ncbi:MAG TPA: V-type ATPase subunit [Ruminococcus flavefaciens]|nr:V-type ATPase subunit [Ruminococcus flavefaciens]